jgi:hypothetical protein
MMSWDICMLKIPSSLRLSRLLALETGKYMKIGKDMEIEKALAVIQKSFSGPP